ncbi:hypothetical protein [Niabella ginsengisoli]|uniref:Uncharacterized protein n=1 Tax=Niabella ginsengisoli TaxID=522298 RepID=A0ABS9SQP0_9BACT|nr:hypothetical protein [Niabella ginsengisoli]MCH5600677.1 hypothetical protein [Niabella ginsengisoli]
MELGLLFDNTEWKERSYNMINGLSTVAVKYPTSFGVWLSCFYQQITGTKEIVLIGDYETAFKELLQQPSSHSVIMAAKEGNDQFPLLKNKFSDESLSIFLCENYSCKKPVYNIVDLFATM